MNQNLNYVRNSVKVVVNAYTGKMTFYDVTSLTKTKDPILQTWEKVFPGMFTPVSQMRPRLSRPTSATPRTSCRSRPPPTAATTSPSRSTFYNATNAWNVSPERRGGLARPGAARPP